MIGVILNPAAAGNRRRPGRAERFAAILGETGEVVATDSVARLEEALVHLRERGVKVLAICGGDGSLYHAVAKAIEVWGESSMPPLLILAAGTINNVANSLGPRQAGPEAALEAVVAALRAGTMPATRRRPVMRVNGEDYGHIVGAGTVVRFLELYYSGRRPGPASAMLLLVVLGLSWIFRGALVRSVMEPFDAKVECDGKPLAFPSFTILLASTVEHIGLGMKPFYRNRSDGDAFHLLAGPSTAGQLLVRIVRFLRGRPARLASLYDGSARRVVVRFASPQQLTINGEILGRVTRLEIESGPLLEFVI